MQQTPAPVRQGPLLRYWAQRRGLRGLASSSTAAVPIEYVGCSSTSCRHRRSVVCEHSVDRVRLWRLPPDATFSARFTVDRACKRLQDDANPHPEAVESLGALVVTTVILRYKPRKSSELMCEVFDCDGEGSVLPGQIGRVNVVGPVGSTSNSL